MIFISYSSKDFDAVVLIKKVLEKNGVSCWMAPWSIPPGSDYSSEIPDAIEQCEAFLLIHSRNAQYSNWVPKELDLAITYNKTVIPFQIDSEMLTKPFNFRLTNVQRIEAFHDQERAYEDLLGRIKNDTKSVRSDYAYSDLPGTFSYFQMLGVKDICEIRVAELRKQADITESLSVPIGLGAQNRIAHLDLHQKGDGPHGLIIGPAGSGKSEFLRTVSLSLGLFYSSEDVRIHMIDLKGGDAIRELEGLPHLGVCLSECSDSAVNTFIETMEKEIRNRYELLEKHCVSNIYQYLKLRKINKAGMEAMPHLVIAFDELRELKVYYPEIMSKLKEWGNRMNASLLGIHLIFSTQYYEGLIDDATWNMVDYRICSSMQKKAKDAGEDEVSRCPGRLYLQSKSRSEVQLIQLAYCCSEIKDKNTEEFYWFFEKQSQKNELINLIRRYEMD